MATTHQELPAHQKDIRWLFWWVKEHGLPPPSSEQATAFAERVAIMIFEAGLSQQEARDAAASALQPPRGRPNDGI